MKKPKQEPQIKSARKTAKKSIQVRLISSLKAVAGQFGYDEKKLTKKVKRISKKLAKAIAEELELPKPATPKIPAAIKVASASIPVKTVNKSKTPAPAKAKSGKPANKVASKTVPAKPKTATATKLKTAKK